MVIGKKPESEMEAKSGTRAYRITLLWSSIIPVYEMIISGIVG